MRKTRSANRRTPSSAINNAEYVPILSEAVDDYVNANFDLAVRLGCGWIVGMEAITLAI